ncbi:MAG: XRE family transcriptional regulator [Albidovulum sp.]
MTKPSDPHGLYAAVGQAVKEARLRSGMTLAQLSKESGVSTAMISKIERGDVSASLASLNALASAMDLPVINLFAATAGQSEISFVKAGEGVTVRRSGSTYGHEYVLIGRSLSGGIEVESYLITLSNQDVHIPFFHQPGQVELIQVVSGEMTYRCGDQIYEMAPGDTLTFEAGAPHGPIVLKTPNVVFLTVVASRQA